MEGPAASGPLPSTDDTTVVPPEIFITASLFFERSRSQQEERKQNPGDNEPRDQHHQQKVVENGFFQEVRSRDRWPLFRERFGHLIGMVPGACLDRQAALDRHLAMGRRAKLTQQSLKPLRIVEEEKGIRRFASSGSGRLRISVQDFCAGEAEITGLHVILATESVDSGVGQGFQNKIPDVVRADPGADAFPHPQISQEFLPRGFRIDAAHGAVSADERSGRFLRVIFSASSLRHFSMAPWFPESRTPGTSQPR